MSTDETVSIASFLSVQRRLWGVVAMVVSVGAASLLTLEQLVGLTLRGCGPDSGCASLASGPWGSLLGWPVSYLGLAYFVGLLGAWAISGEKAGRVFRWLVRLGGAASLGFLLIMVAEAHFCPYCLVAHLGNFTFLLIVETSPQAAPTSRKTLAGFTTLFAVVTISLAVVRTQVERQVSLNAQRETEQTVHQVLAAADKAVRADMTQPPFTGRWRRGPEVAALRIVMWGDYQCKDCAQAETELEPFVDDRVSVCFLHYPLCKDCNRVVKHPRFHDNACLAASAAEAAGKLAGRDGFWRMHRWLMQRQGKFTHEELKEALPELGLADVDKFFVLMNSPEIRQLIEEDIERAIDLGIDSTPLVFVNGVELKSADVEGNVAKALGKITASPLPARSPTVDQPPSSLVRLVRRWNDQETVEFPHEPAGYRLGPQNALHRLTLVLDYANPYSVNLDQQARRLVEERTDVSYRVLLFPLTKELNPRFQRWERDFYGPSSLMARLVEASGQLGGEETFWAMHCWVLNHQADFTLVAGLQAASELGLDREQLQARMQSPEVEQALQANIQALEAIDIKWASTLYVDGKQVTAAMPSYELLERVLAE